MEKKEPDNGVNRRRFLQGVAALSIAGGRVNAAGTGSVMTKNFEGTILAGLRPQHPRLIATSSSWDEIRKRRGEDTALDAFLRRSETEARALFDAPPVTYIKQGRRLLHVSRMALRRVLLLSLHFHLTGDEKFVSRAKDEMLAAAGFADWNPSHFLDVGEMTAALAFGYDWLFQQLDDTTKLAVRTAIVEKGLKQGLIVTHWMRNENNWNQVCHAGMSLGALTIAEDEPELAAQTLEKTKQFNGNGLKPYAPEGVYPEGAMYWAYGTTFQTVLLSALKSALGTDWALSQSPGFLLCGDALNQQLGPTNTYFNFSDNIESPGLEPAMWWFASTLGKPELLRYETAQLKRYAESTQPPRIDSEDNRLLPLAALWWPGKASGAPSKLPLSWYGRGPNPLVTFRGAWDDPKTMYLALKGGKASLSHGHMDAGSFIFEANGVRWACDLGMQDYYSLESKNIGLWSGTQDGERWSIFRLNSLSHNTLTINGRRHRVDGDATVTDFSAEAKTASLDMSPVFAGSAETVTRSFSFVPGSHAAIHDELAGLKAGDSVRWTFLTRAEISIDAAGTSALLRQKGQELRVDLQSTVPAKFESAPATPPRDFDAPNPGMSFLLLNLTAPEGGLLNFTVTLRPGAQTL